MIRRIIFEMDDEFKVDKEIILLQRRPRIFYKHKNYLELYDKP
jgi:hypothetical protein